MTTTLLRAGDYYGETGYVECYEGDHTVVAGDSDVVDVDGQERHVCHWCSGKYEASEPGEWEQAVDVMTRSKAIGVLIAQTKKEATVTHKEFHETIRAIAKAAGKQHWLTRTVANEYSVGGPPELLLQWEAYIDGFGWRTGSSAQSVVDIMRGAAQGVELDLSEFGEPPAATVAS